MFIHQPFGTFDFTGPEFARFLPAGAATALPLDVFVVGSRNPATIMAEYARLTGHPELAPLWSLGYLQSHRTLGDRAEMLAEPDVSREKAALRCDDLLGHRLLPQRLELRITALSSWN